MNPKKKILSRNILSTYQLFHYILHQVAHIDCSALSGKQHESLTGVWGIVAWVLSQYKNHLSRYGDSHYKDKKVVRLSYIYNGNSYTDKMTSLYWISPLMFFFWSPHLKYIQQKMLYTPPNTFYCSDARRLCHGYFCVSTVKSLI